LRTRIAPTPSGYLHLGNAVSFLLTWLWARSHQGSLHLRIDDLDAERKESRYVDDIFTQLRWLGIEWDSGPRDREDFERSFSQRHRLPLYREALAELRQKGALFACTCSRSQIFKLAPSGLYPGNCYKLALDFDAGDRAWRARVPAGTAPNLGDLLRPAETLRLDEALGDFVILRRDGLPAYQIASLVDDRVDQIDFIVRGEDLRPSTAAQRHLADQVGWDFARKGTLHHPLFRSRSEEGKLSKSHKSLSIREARMAGLEAADVYRRTAKVLGLKVPSGRLTLDELQSAFDPKRLLERGFVSEEEVWIL
jgi:glutamyl/glutaminyl-tRNA synthetase